MSRFHRTRNLEAIALWLILFAMTNWRTLCLGPTELATARRSPYDWFCLQWPTDKPYVLVQQSLRLRGDRLRTDFVCNDQLMNLMPRFRRACDCVAIALWLILFAMTNWRTLCLGPTEPTTARRSPYDYFFFAMTNWRTLCLGPVELATARRSYYDWFCLQWTTDESYV